MIKKQILFTLLAIITMLSITQLFASSKESESYPYIPREINLSGNIINFSMPENFSKDMPAYDLVENLNLNDSSFFEKNNSYTLLRRWWDFKDNSFFSKNVGTMMMTIHVYKNVESSNDISHPVSFVKTLLMEMDIRSKDENKKRRWDDIVFFPEHYQSFIQLQYNKKNWLSSGAGTKLGKDKAFYYWIPISEDNYLAVEFHFAPNNNIDVRPFIDVYCRDLFEKIMSSFDVVYSSDNNIKSKLESNAHLELQKLIEELD